MSSKRPVCQSRAPCSLLHVACHLRHQFESSVSLLVAAAVRVFVEPYVEEDNNDSCCKQLCWGCKAAYNRTNRVLRHYSHEDTEFQLGGKPSDLCAVDAGALASSVMLLAHVVVLILISFFFSSLH